MSTMLLKFIERSFSKKKIIRRKTINDKENKYINMFITNNINTLTHTL